MPSFPLLSSISFPASPFIIILLLFGIFLSAVFLYCYIALSLTYIAQRAKKGPTWWAWVPVWNILLMLKVVEKPLWWLLFFFLPFFNIIFVVFLYSQIARQVKEPEWVGFLILIPVVNIFLPGYLAYRASKSTTPLVILGGSVVSLIFVLLLSVLSVLSIGNMSSGPFFGGNPTPARTVSNLGGPLYRNEPYGFSLSLTPSWADYQVEEVQPADDLVTTQFRFIYGPSLSESGIGIHLFVIDVYPVENWYWVKSQCELGENAFCGEEIGSNESYAFVFSLVTGDPPPEISPQVLEDIKSIKETFVPQIPQQKLSDETLQRLRMERLNRFRNSAIEYQNCKHGYVISYPVGFSHNGMTEESDIAIISGMGLTITIEATYLDRGMTLESFSRDRIKMIHGKQEGLLETTRNGIPFLLYQFTDPASSVSFWEKAPYLYEIRYEGMAYEDMRRVVKNISGTLNANVSASSCL